ncbi:MAG: outer membrane beta-barrel protein, partial [Aeromicrobium sp.]|nr:outer membrane beta-barrel protein [Burkholderiales bacterium]
MNFINATHGTRAPSKQRKIAWLVKALLVLASPAALAEEPYWYAGASVGETRAKIDNDRIISNLLRGGFTAATMSNDDRDTGYKIFGGYQMTRYFALEGGYVDLGKFGFTTTTVPIGTLTGRIKIQGANLDLVGTLPVTERFSAFARVGAFYGRSRDEFGSTGLVSVVNRTPSKTETNLKAGVGLQYAFTDA